MVRDAFRTSSHSLLYSQGLWVWLADHDLDSMSPSEVRYSGRGILSESIGPTWLIGSGRCVSFGVDLN